MIKDAVTTRKQQPKMTSRIFRFRTEFEPSSATLILAQLSLNCIASYLSNFIAMQNLESAMNIITDLKMKNTLSVILLYLTGTYSFVSKIREQKMSRSDDLINLS